MSDGFYKVIDYPTVGDSGELFARVVPSTGGRHFVKTAGMDFFSPKIKEYASGLKSSPGNVYVIINAMGAGEYYGPNINGDFFGEDVLREYHPTFVTDGTPFLHHVNKDPSKGYGTVLASDYNELMHRVELVVKYELDKLGRKYADKINNGELVNVSMGCRVPYDICSICGNMAKSPANYCCHLKDSPGLGRMLDDGRRAFAINTKPTFFDISIVTVPADATARVLMKVAGRKKYYFTKSASERARDEGLTTGVEEAKAPVTTVIRISNEDAEKVRQIAPQISKMMEAVLAPPTCNQELDELARGFSSPLSLIRSIISRGLFFRPEERQRMILVSSGMKDMADRLDRDKVLIDEPAPKSLIEKVMGCPEECSSLGNFDCRSMSPDNVKKVVVTVILNKTAAMQEVPYTESYRRLKTGDYPNEYSPFHPDTALKSLAAVGMLNAVAENYTGLGKLIAEEQLPQKAMVFAANIHDATESIDRALDAPVQTMRFDNPDIYGNMLAGASHIKMSSATGAEFPWAKAMAGMIAVPAMAKAMQHWSRQKTQEDMQLTGQYSPSMVAPFIENMALTVPTGLYMFMKHADSPQRKKVNEFVKKAEATFKQPFRNLYAKHKEVLVDSLSKVLFGS